MVLTLLRPPPLGKPLEPHVYAALQTLDDPNEICTYEAVPSPWVPQAEHVREVTGTPRGRGSPSATVGAGRWSVRGSPRPTTPLAF